MSVLRAIIVGQLVVNLPVVGIIGIIAWAGTVLIGPGGIAAYIIAGSLLAWIWWSFSVPRWRRWAHQQGVDRERLQRYAVLTGLVWRKGSVFEKTEFRPPQKND